MYKLACGIQFLSVNVSIFIGATTASGAQVQSSVKLIKSVDLVGYTGDFDHFAVDYDRNRLLLAAEDHGTLEVFDLNTSEHLRTVGYFGNHTAYSPDEASRTSSSRIAKKRCQRFATRTH